MAFDIGLLCALDTGLLWLLWLPLAPGGALTAGRAFSDRARPSACNEDVQGHRLHLPWSSPSYRRTRTAWMSGWMMPGMVRVIPPCAAVGVMARAANSAAASARMTAEVLPDEQSQSGIQRQASPATSARQRRTSWWTDVGQAGWWREESMEVQGRDKRTPSDFSLVQMLRSSPQGSDPQRLHQRRQLRRIATR